MSRPRATCLDVEAASSRYGFGRRSPIVRMPKHGGPTNYRPI
ncbi:conserved hypothetical protein [Burkholderia pseudomallei Pakistan 9]|uniref:Uncharacterized protein n=1 Tax=Burkholderia pseudomallei (strain 1106a) TaxID=357348 RepID=A3P7S9_BURP0|nr:hypothetical protein BURPS1106A_A2356 [Burkholderia pseudomallei 1106a]EEC34857.1 conserved hypothetical protein [Burkholderia pseudomallei 576]EEH28029.1 conserved hypothetical protein [Burkholderia pseudomallei Pakistan 9]EEP51746.1 conserved hypothetical protein [Burkholderia pseudomallei MSHR346]